MAIIKCKMCGGDMELSADQQCGTCQYCGSTTTLPRVDDEQRAAAFNRGNHFRRIGEFDKALAVYESIVREDDGDAEAHWCCALCRFGIEYVQDPDSGAYLPTCHRASFDSFLEDVDYQAALLHADAAARAQYRREGEQIASIQRDILATVQKEQPFDVFLCYKETDQLGQRTVDSTLAQEIYYQLTQQGRRVFFARITLEDKAGQAYEPYIFAALRSARVMVVVGTRPEHLNAAWVKNEWSRFLALMKTDRKKLLIPCYRDMDPYDLPEQLSVLQSYDMSKIGFLQDLVRGISKVLDGDGSASAGEDRREGGGSLTALLKRGRMALEDREWTRADRFFEQALNIDAENARAFYGKALAAHRCQNAGQLAEARLGGLDLVGEREAEACPEDDQRIGGLIQELTIPVYLEGLEVYKLLAGGRRTFQARTPDIQEVLDGERAYFESDKLMGRAIRYARGDLARELEGLRNQVLGTVEEALAAARESDRQAAEEVARQYQAYLDQREQEARRRHDQAEASREADYNNAVASMEKAAKSPPETLKEAANLMEAAAGLFKAIGAYKDTKERAEECWREAARMRYEYDKAQKEAAEQARREEERKAKLAAEEAARKARQAELLAAQRRARNRRLAIGAGIGAAAVAAMVLLLTQLVIPTLRYSRAEGLLAEGDYAGAGAAFAQISGFRDAWDRAKQARVDLAQEELALGHPEQAAAAYIQAGDPITAASVCDLSTRLWAGRGLSIGIPEEGQPYYQGDGDFAEPEYRSAVLEMAAILDMDDHDGPMGLDGEGRVVVADEGYFSRDVREEVLSWSGLKQLVVEPYYAVGLLEDGTVRVAYDRSDPERYVVCSGWHDIVSIGPARGNGVWGIGADGTAYYAAENGAYRYDLSGLPPVRKLLTVNSGVIALGQDGTVHVVPGEDEEDKDLLSLDGKSGVADLFTTGSGMNTVALLMSDGTVESWHSAYYQERYGQVCQDISRGLSGWKDVVALYAVPGGIGGITAQGKVLCQITSYFDREINGETVYSLDSSIPCQADLEALEDVVFLDWSTAGSDYRYYIMALRSDGGVTATGDGKYYTRGVDEDYHTVYTSHEDGTYHLVSDWAMW